MKKIVINSDETIYDMKKFGIDNDETINIWL